jgi:predicted acylesterase/phospholipase RssA
LAKDIPFDITLKDFYEYSKIELHAFVFELNNFVTEDISYLTHPTMRVLDAIWMSSSIPVLMVPTIIENKCYVDGGFCANYPITYCIDSGKKIDEILGFRNKYCDYQENVINANSTLIDFVLCIFFKIFNYIFNKPPPKIKYEVLCNLFILNLETINSILNSTELRKEFYEIGIKSAKVFLESNTNTNINTNINDSTKEKDSS